MRDGLDAIDPVRRVGTYLVASARVAARHPRAFRPGALARHFPAWWASLDRGAPVEDQPWLCFEAIERLGAWLRPGMQVFEWGSGGSTLFFAERAASVRSVEHDRAWYEVVRERLARRGAARCDLRLVEPDPAAGPPADPADPHGNASGDARFRAASFARYVNAIAEVADGSLDLVLVDGRARPSCCRAAMPKVRPGGLLVLDNAEVPYYDAARRLLGAGGWALTDVWGPIPGARHFSETCLFRRSQP